MPRSRADQRPTTNDGEAPSTQRAAPSTEERSDDMSEQLQLHIEDAEGVLPLWDRTLQAAVQRLGRDVITSWLADTHPLSLQNGVLTLGAPNSMARDWIDQKYSRVLAESFREAHGSDVAVAVVVSRNGATGRADGRPPGATGRGTTNDQRSTTNARSQEPGARSTSAATPPPGFAPLPLNEKYTFDHFIVGASNRFAHAAAVSVAQRPGKNYNPLFLYGGVGLGKTHLLQAIGQEILREQPGARVSYVSGETFTSHFIASLREGREEAFKRWYRSVEVWLVDDVQFIADKNSTKEEFFHTFNELYLTNRQIVLASDRPPRELRLLEDRLRSRLESGLMAEVGPPDLETRVAILEKRAALEGAEVAPEVLLMIAGMVEGNVRVLEAALIRVLALASLTRSAITPELASSALVAYAPEGSLGPIGVQRVQKAVCERFGVPEEALTGNRRDKRSTLARQVAMYLVREVCRTSLAQIGDLFGGKSHSTVLYSCQKLEAEMKKDLELAAAVQQLSAGLRKR
jgi:chromosomal replication initiator protein